MITLFMHRNVFEYVCFICFGIFCCSISHTLFFFFFICSPQTLVRALRYVADWPKKFSALIRLFFLRLWIIVETNSLIFKKLPNRKGSTLWQALCMKFATYRDIELHFAFSYDNADTSIFMYHMSM